MIDVFIGYLVPTVHVLACLFLIVVVLLQTGKGADMGAAFGGGSQTLFGAGGAGNLLTKLTTGTAIAFMVTSLILSYGQSRAPGSRLLDQIPADAAAPSPNAATSGAAGTAAAVPTAPPTTPTGEAPANEQ
jgi:preprotein translocase subunit SecG